MKVKRCEHGVRTDRTCLACEAEFAAAWGLRNIYNWSPAPILMPALQSVFEWVSDRVRGNQRR